MGSDVRLFIEVLMAIVIVGLAYVLVSHGTQTGQVVSSGFGGLSSFLGTAMGNNTAGMTGGG